MILKNPDKRSKREIEFLVLYLKYQFPVFEEIEKPALQMFVQRLGFALHKPGDMIAKKGDRVKGMTMIIDGQVDATEIEPQDE